MLHFCHSERSEEALLAPNLKADRFLAFARNDSIWKFFANHFIRVRLLLSCAAV
jgi:hypothetical protein